MNFHFDVYLSALGAVLALALFAWGLSVVKRDVSIVDSFWALFFACAAATSLVLAAAGPRAALVAILLGIWALRLTLYIIWRNWGTGEDHRYVAIRARNEPNFALKSLYLVFALQAVLAWIIFAPVHAAIVSVESLTWLDVAGAALLLFGTGFEATADWQLARFKADPANRKRVMDRGLWHYTRHPNYFGECCVWWGVYLLAVAAGAWWTLFSPVLMTVLLLRVSGVKLLEADITQRRPEYRDYIERTSAFIPWRPRAHPGAHAPETAR